MGSQFSSKSDTLVLILASHFNILNIDTSWLSRPSTRSVHLPMRYLYIKMGEEDETMYIEYNIESTVLEHIDRRSFVTSSNSSNKTGADEDKWRWVKLCPRCAGSVLDCGKNSSSKYWQYLEVALLSAVVVVVLLLMLPPTIFYNLPLPVRYLRFTFVYNIV